jgi:hypothetical protein
MLASAVHIRRGEQGYPESERAVDSGDGFLVMACAVEFRHSHAPEPDGRNRQSILEFRVFWFI